jgi:hypothetical protein
MKRKGFLVDISDEDRKMLEDFGKMRGWSVSKTIRICMRASILVCTAKAANMETGMQKSIYIENGEK